MTKSQNARARMTSRIFALSLVAITMMNCTPLSTVPVASQEGTTTTIILVRHAERNEGLDPPLNDEGIARAAALADALSDHGVTAVYCVDFLRNRQTCAAVAEPLGLEVNIIPLTRFVDTNDFANDFVDEVLDLHAGGVVLFVGNTSVMVINQPSNLAAIYQRLGGTDRAPTRYSDMYIAIIPEEGDVHFIEATYGGTSSLD